MSARTRTRRAPDGGQRPAVSLVEVVISTLVMALLVGASSAAVHMVAYKGAGTELVAQEQATLGTVMNRLRQELSVATAVTELTGASITFTTADVAGSGTNTLRYALSNGALTRQVNSDPETNLALPCDEFSLLADADAVLAPLSIVDDTEFVLAEHQTYPLIAIISTAENSLTTTAWQAATFLPTNASALSFKVTRVSVTGRRTTTATTGTITAQIRQCRPGTYDPGSSVIDTATYPVNLLSTTATPFEITFANATALAIGTEYALVLSSSRTDTNVRVTYDMISLAPPDDGTYYRRTTDSGGSWTPATASNTRDLKFQLRGRYQITDPDEARVIERGWLRSMSIHMVTHVGNSKLMLDGGVVCVNQPNLAGLFAADLPLIKAPQ